MRGSAFSRRRLTNESGIPRERAAKRIDMHETEVYLPSIRQVSSQHLKGLSIFLRLG
jgi:hypothetical protein